MQWRYGGGASHCMGTYGASTGPCDHGRIIVRGRRRRGTRWLGGRKGGRRRAGGVRLGRGGSAGYVGDS